jgi:uncharacterized membrane protein YhaH (DUF805 family)
MATGFCVTCLISLVKQSPLFLRSLRLCGSTELIFHNREVSQCMRDLAVYNPSMPNWLRKLFSRFPLATLFLVLLACYLFFAWFPLEMEPWHDRTHPWLKYVLLHMPVLSFLIYPFLLIFSIMFFYGGFGPVERRMKVDPQSTRWPDRVVVWFLSAAVVGLHLYMIYHMLYRREQLPEVP